MNTLMIWAFWLYIVPMIALILLMLSEGYNPFTNENAKLVFTPFVNIYHLSIYCWRALLLFLISWIEVFDSLKKRFF
jgi:hypothetical protein